MKISELVEKLEAIKIDVGDAEVLYYFATEDFCFEVENIETIVYDKQPTFVVLY